VAAGQPGEAWRIWQRDAPGHPSPNAGPVEASFAGALGLRLGGINSYGDEVEDRGTLGDGPRPQVPDIRRTAELAGRVALAAAGLAMILASRSPRRSAGKSREARWT
jgi:adenosylcobinamide-phosphate synthase